MTKVTTEQLLTAQQNAISKSTVYDRIYRGWDVEKAITIPTSKKFRRATEKGGRMIAGRLLTNAQVQTAFDNGIIDITLWHRIDKRWSIEKAITQPSRKRNALGEGGQQEMSQEEVVEIIGRIKAFNKADTSGFPITIPKPLMKKVERLGINFEEIEPIAVEEVEQ